MNRIFEFLPSPEEAVVSRILMLVHQTMDQHLPSAAKANRQFTKTVFSNDVPGTAAPYPAAEGDEHGFKASAPSSAFGSYEETSPDGRVAPLDEVDAHGVARAVKPQLQTRVPPSSRDVGRPSPSGSLRPPSGIPVPAPMGDDDDLLSSSPTNQHLRMSPDWVTRVSLVFLVAGLVMLAYVLLS